MDEYSALETVDDNANSENGTTSTYEAFFRTAYDNKFTMDISNKMQMPDRLGPVSNPLDSYLATQSQANSLNAAEDLYYGMDPSYYMVGTPPSVLKAQDALYSEDEEEDVHSYKQYSQQLNNGLINKLNTHKDFTSVGTPERFKSDMNGAYDAAAMPMTPGTLLIAQSGDEMALIRRQLGKLISHVRRLEDENSRRQQREYILYPLVLGFCVYQIARIIIGYK